MSIAALPYELDSIQKLREQELEEARTIQGVMLPRNHCVACRDNLS